MDLFAAQQDASQFPRPGEFLPERYLHPVSGRFRRLEQDVSFGLGRRACLGEQLAQRELLVFFASLIGRFRFELGAEAAAVAARGPEGVADLLRGTGGHIRAPGGWKLRVTRVGAVGV